MKLFNKMKEPIFLKESSNMYDQLQELKLIEPRLNEEGKKLIQQDIRLLEYGLIGEKNIAFELRNSHMPMVILHDIYLEHEGLQAQIDYMVFTRKLCFVLECKNLYGDITITNTGDFIRTMEFSGRKKKEGIYSPITQNQRHMELLKQILIKQKNGKLQRVLVERYFYDTYRSAIVLTNPKTVLHTKYAHKDIKNQVFRVDQLITYMKKANEKSDSFSSSDEELIKWAQRFLNAHKEKQIDYAVKYEPYLKDNQVTEESLEESELYHKLKEYRLIKSREENIKPYFIYNNLQLKELILKMPMNKNELLYVSGFGEKKVDKYGDDILSILLNDKQ